MMLITYFMRWMAINGISESRHPPNYNLLSINKLQSDVYERFFMCKNLLQTESGS